MSVYESCLWKAFHSLFLIKNCRQKGDLMCAELLNQIKIGEQTKKDIALFSTGICQKLDAVAKDFSVPTEPSCIMSIRKA